MNKMIIPLYELQENTVKQLEALKNGDKTWISKVFSNEKISYYKEMFALQTLEIIVEALNSLSNTVLITEELMDNQVNDYLQQLPQLNEEDLLKWFASDLYNLQWLTKAHEQVTYNTTGKHLLTVAQFLAITSNGIAIWNTLKNETRKEE